MAARFTPDAHGPASTVRRSPHLEAAPHGTPGPPLSTHGPQIGGPS